MRYEKRKFLFIVISVVIFICCSKYTKITMNEANEDNQHDDDDITLTEDELHDDDDIVLTEDNQHDDHDKVLTEDELHRNIIEIFYSKRKNWTTSNLGSILFKNVDPERYKRNGSEAKTFVVLFWRHWDWLKQRHLYNFGAHNNGSVHALDDCSVKNCIVTGDDEYLSSADAVVIHMQKKQLPVTKKINPKQRWIFLNDESPINKFFMGKNSSISWKDMSHVFNWTMTYSTDADIPVPYGRTIPMCHSKIVNTDTNVALKELVPHWEKKKLNNHILIIASDCRKVRMQFIQRLQRYINVDVFGNCSRIPKNRDMCPGYFKVDCILPVKYLFYLVLENSKCSQYITEKVFQHAYSKGAIPVIMGPSVQDAEDFLPPNSFLHVENYRNVQDLTKHMTEISRNISKILSFHAWRKHFVIANEHGYFKTRSYHLCRICEALNYNDVAEKSYDENALKTYFNENLLCDLSEISWPEDSCYFTVLMLCFCIVFYLFTIKYILNIIRKS